MTNQFEIWKHNIVIRITWNRFYLRNHVGVVCYNQIKDFTGLRPGNRMTMLRKTKIVKKIYEFYALGNII